MQPSLHLPLPARPAIERYWRYLIPPIAFPPVALIATEFSDLSLDLLAFLVSVAFFASFAPVLWLLVSKGVRYSFWIVTGGAYFAAGVATSLVNFIIRLLAA